MKTRAYTLRDYATIRSWYLARNMEPVASFNLPKFGLIVPDIACCWLSQTDSTACFVEGLIANPRANAGAIKEAVAMIHDELLAYAKQEGFKQAFILTSHPSVELECKRKHYENLGSYNLHKVEL